jgi:uncharacterized protein (TIGR02217 family)
VSNAILPTLPGLAWDRARAPLWSTTVKRSVGGREYRAANWSYPLYQYKLNYEVLRQAEEQEYEELLGFINARQGSFDTFLYLDTWNRQVTAQVFAVGDGATTQFQLVRTFGGVVEPVLGIVTTPQIFVNGVLQVSGVTVSAEGVVTFTSPPAAAASLTWTGTYYWRCRFMKDSYEFNEMLYGLHELQGLSFVTVKA